MIFLNEGLKLKLKHLLCICFNIKNFFWLYKDHTFVLEQNFCLQLDRVSNQIYISGSSLHWLFQSSMPAILLLLYMSFFQFHSTHFCFYCPVEFCWKRFNFNMWFSNFQSNFQLKLFPQNSIKIKFPNFMVFELDK